VAGLNRLMGSQPFFLLKLGFKRQYRYEQMIKYLHKFASTKKNPHTIIKINDDQLVLNINMYWMLQCLNYFFLGSCINPACNLWIWSKVSRPIPVEFKS
jgi:hypothetical protein